MFRITGRFISYNRIDISKFTKSFNDYSDEFRYFCINNNVKPPNIKSMSGQGICLLTIPENFNKYTDRDGLNIFYRNIGRIPRDSIQCVNKCEQWGLKKVDIKGLYMIPFPFKYIDIHIIKRNIPKDDIANRDKKINMVKHYIMHNYINISNESWHIGHRDPNKGNSNSNIIYQPPIQARFRDRFKFDKIGLTKYPTLNELLGNFSKYYSYEEQLLIYQWLNDIYAEGGGGGGGLPPEGGGGGGGGLPPGGGGGGGLPPGGGGGG